MAPLPVAAAWRRLGRSAAAVAPSDNVAQWELTLGTFMLALVLGLAVLLQQEWLSSRARRVSLWLAGLASPARAPSRRRARGRSGLVRVVDDEEAANEAAIELQALEARRRARAQRAAAASGRPKPGRASSCVGSAAGISVAGSLPGDASAHLHHQGTHMLPPQRPPPRQLVSPRHRPATVDRRSLRWRIPLTQLTSYRRWTGADGAEEDDGREGRPLRTPQSPYKRRARGVPVRLRTELEIPVYSTLPAPRGPLMEAMGVAGDAHGVCAGGGDERIYDCDGHAGPRMARGGAQVSAIGLTLPQLD